MLNLHIIATVNQKVLSFLAKFSDKEFYERQIARKSREIHQKGNCNPERGRVILYYSIKLPKAPRLNRTLKVRVNTPAKQGFPRLTKPLSCAVR